MLIQVIDRRPALTHLACLICLPVRESPSIETWSMSSSGCSLHVVSHIHSDLRRWCVCAVSYHIRHCLRILSVMKKLIVLQSTIASIHCPSPFLSHLYFLNYVYRIQFVSAAYILTDYAYPWAVNDDSWLKWHLMGLNIVQSLQWYQYCPIASFVGLLSKDCWDLICWLPLYH